LVEDWGHLIYELSQGETIQATVCDHDAEGRATLERHMAHTADDCGSRRGVASTRAALKDVEIGVDKVAGRLRKAGDGKPRLFLLRDSLVSRDPLLDEAKKPCCTEEEIESYVWDEVTGGRLGDRTLEEPRAVDNHGMDAKRYMVMYFEDPRALYAGLIGKKMSAPDPAMPRPRWRYSGGWPSKERRERIDWDAAA
jgi:hypothetical protein